MTVEMRIGPSKRFDPQHCPWCDRLVTGLAAIGYDDTPPPSPDDISFCIYCGEFSIYTHDLKLRKPTEMETIEAGSIPEIRMARETWVRLKGKGP